MKPLKYGGVMTNTCLLCDGKPSVMGVFDPYNQQMYDAPINKHRFIVYYLCDHCFNQPDKLDQIEATIRAKYVSGKN